MPNALNLTAPKYDGLHPNDRGMARRANDLVEAVRKSLSARYNNRALQAAADETFGKI